MKDINKKIQSTEITFRRTEKVVISTKYKIHFWKCDGNNKWCSLEYFDDVLNLHCPLSPMSLTDTLIVLSHRDQRFQMSHFLIRMNRTLTKMFYCFDSLRTSQNSLVGDSDNLFDLTSPVNHLLSKLTKVIMCYTLLYVIDFHFRDSVW